MLELNTLFARANTGNILTWTMQVDSNKYRSITGIKDGNLIEQAWTTCKGKNIGRANETSPNEQAEKEARAKWDKKIKEGYFEDINDIDNFKFVQPQLAQTYKSPRQIENEKKIIAKAPEEEREKRRKDLRKYEKRLERLQKHFQNGGVVYVDFKYDGVRDEVTQRGMFTRTGEPCVSAPHIFESLKHLFDKHPNLVLDGELYSHEYRDKLNQINSLASKRKPTEEDLKESKEILRYFIYDSYNFNGVTQETKFSERKEVLRELIKDIPFVYYVESKIARSMEDLDRYHEEAVGIGMEGTMIKFNEPYENKRSENTWKRKDFLTEEFKIVAFHSGDGKKSTMAAKATALLPDGREFDTNIKGDFKWLTELLVNQDKYINKLGTIRFLKYTEYGIPYLPYLLTFRSDTPETAGQ